MFFWKSQTKYILALNICIYIFSIMDKYISSRIARIIFKVPVREDTHKKSDFLSGRTTKDLPYLYQWLSGPCHFF